MDNLDAGKVVDFLKNLIGLKEYAASRLAKHFDCEPELLFYKYLRDDLLEEGSTKTDDSFLFHGYGCSVKNDKEGWSVDLEFGPKGNVCAFDRHTLCHLLNYEVDKCDWLINQLHEKEIIELCDKELHEVLIDNPNFSNWESVEQEMDAGVADRYTFKENNQNQ